MKRPGKATFLAALKEAKGEWIDIEQIADKMWHERPDWWRESIRVATCRLRHEGHTIRLRRTTFYRLERENKT